MEDRCVCCGRTVPEGTWVCATCKVASGITIKSRETKGGIIVTKKELSRIYCIEKEIAMWEQELQKLGEESLISSPGFDGMPGGSFKTDSQQERRAIEKLTIEQTINTLYEELLRTRAELTAWITSIDDSYLRQILYHRCVQAMSWQEVCDAMSLGSSDGIRKAYDRFVDKNFPRK